MSCNMVLYQGIMVVVFIRTNIQPKMTMMVMSTKAENKPETPQHTMII